MKSPVAIITTISTRVMSNFSRRSRMAKPRSHRTLVVLVSVYNVIVMYWKNAM